MSLFVLVLLCEAICVVAGVLAFLVTRQEDTGRHCAGCPVPAPRRVNGRYLGTLPRIATPDHPPWPTAGQPAINAEAGPTGSAGAVGRRP